MPYGVWNRGLWHREKDRVTFSVRTTYTSVTENMCTAWKAIW